MPHRRIPHTIREQLVLRDLANVHCLTLLGHFSEDTILHGTPETSITILPYDCGPISIHHENAIPPYEWRFAGGPIVANFHIEDLT